MKLNKEEKELLDSYEKGEWKSAPRSELKRYVEAARTTFKKDKRLNIRISTKDLLEIQKRALEEGIPYQTLAASILHKYVTGRMVEAK